MRTGGVGLVLLGLCLIFGGLALHMLLAAHVDSGVTVPPFVGLGVAVLGAGWHRLVRSRGYKAATAAERVRLDTRPPVLYLRSFADDQVAGRRTTLGARSEEEQMVNVLRRIGPVVALGAPGERVPMLGAARDYVAEGHWRDWVLDKLQVAALTIIRVSDKDAFWWEVEMAARHVPPERTAFLLPSAPDGYASFRARVAGIFPQADSLPETLPRLDPTATPFLPVEDLWGLLYFDGHGRAQLRSRVLHAATVREALLLVLAMSKTQPHHAPFESMFNPLLRRTGARVHPTPRPLGILAMLGSFYFLIPLMAWNRLKGRPAIGPAALDADFDPWPPEVTDPWSRVFARAVAPVLALVPVCAAAVLLLAPSVATGATFLGFTLAAWLPLAVVVVLALDARLRRHENLKVPELVLGLYGGFLGLLAIPCAVSVITRPSYAPTAAALFLGIGSAVMGLFVAIRVYLGAARRFAEASHRRRVRRRV
jgi:hypothetical protein